MSLFHRCIDFYAAAVAHRAFDTEMDALRAVRELVDFLPLSNTKVSDYLTAI